MANYVSLMDLVVVRVLDVSLILGQGSVQGVVLIVLIVVVLL